MADRLGRLGDLSRGASSISARLREGTVHVDPAGLCWARFDPADVILPAIPDVLSCPKERVPWDDLKAKYYSAPAFGRASSVRLFLRLESGPLWKALRASAGCGLAPDEHEVARFLLRKASRNIKMVTDYSESESTVIRFGGRRYFESVLTPREASSTLRVAGARAPRSSYLPKDGLLRLGGAPILSEALFDGLGEWCYFTH